MTLYAYVKGRWIETTTRERKNIENNLRTEYGELVITRSRELFISPQIIDVIKSSRIRVVRTC